MAYIEIFWKDRSVSPCCEFQDTIIINNKLGRLEMHNEQYNCIEYVYFEDISASLYFFAFSGL